MITTHLNNKIPRHVAIIMDGNGRWASKRHLPRLLGHKSGVKAVERTVRAAADMGIRYLSLYAFSTENWNRPVTEVQGLMKLFRYYVKVKVNELCAEGVRLRFAGKIKELPEGVCDVISMAERETADQKRLDLIVCLNYGGRQEIVDAINCILTEHPKQEITVDMLHRYLYLSDIPDPDLIIRTSGEMRLSNFWLWQSAYSEFYFTDVLWPDFDHAEFLKAIQSYKERERRYGTIK